MKNLLVLVLLTLPILAKAQRVGHEAYKCSSEKNSQTISVRQIHDHFFSSYVYPDTDFRFFSAEEVNEKTVVTFQRKSDDLKLDLVFPSKVPDNAERIDQFNIWSKSPITAFLGEEEFVCEGVGFIKKFL